VAKIAEPQKQASSRLDELKSPRLVTAYDSSQVTHAKPAQVGYTVAQYGQGGLEEEKHYSPVRQQKHFASEGGERSPQTLPIDTEDPVHLEMTRSAELSLYKEIDNEGTKTGMRQQHIYDEIPANLKPSEMTEKYVTMLLELGKNPRIRSGVLIRFRDSTVFPLNPQR